MIADRFPLEEAGRAVKHMLSGEARDYLVSRFFNDGTLQAYGIGFSADSFDGFHKWAIGKGIAEEALFDAGLVLCGYVVFGKLGRIISVPRKALAVRPR